MSREDFENLYRKESDRVYRYIFMLVRHSETAEDLTHDTFYRAFRNLHTFKNESSPATWLMRIARNITYDYFRRKRIIRFFSFEKEEVSDERLTSPELLIVEEEEVMQLFNSIRKLKKEYQDVLILRKIDESSIKETAYILGWTEAKVKGMTKRALDMLKKEMIKEEGDWNE